MLVSFCLKINLFYQCSRHFGAICNSFKNLDFASPIQYQFDLHLLMLPHLWNWLWTWYLYDKWNQTEKIYQQKILFSHMFFSPTHLSWECTIAHWWSSDLSWYQDSFCVSNLGSCLTIISVIICESVWFMMIGGHRVRVTTYTSSTSRIFVLEDPSIYSG